LRINLEDALASLEDMRQADSDEGVANTLMRVAVAYLERGKFDLADEALNEAYYYCDKLDNPDGKAHVALRWSEVALAQEQYELAEERLREALTHFESKQNLSSITSALEKLGKVQDKAGRHEDACNSLERALDICYQGGDQVGQLLFQQYLAPVYRKLGKFKQAAKTYAAMGDLARTKGDMQREALAWIGIGTCRAEAGDPKAGANDLAKAKRLFEGLGQLSRAAQVETEIARFKRGEV
jgi:tetratricopeptide (TPR) repeat protein